MEIGRLKSGFCELGLKNKWLNQNFEGRVCEIILPRIQKRSVLEENGQLKPRWSALEEDLNTITAEEEANKIVSRF